MDSDDDTFNTSEQNQTNQSPNSSANPATVAKPWLFQPGDPRINRNGRPPKGESVFEQTFKVVEAKAERVAKAKLARMLRPDAVGARAWDSYRDTYYGIPKQTLVVENAGADAAIDTLLARFVDAEYKLLPDSDTLHT